MRFGKLEIAVKKINPERISISVFPISGFFLVCAAGME
jgi:hypothetical protein